METPKLQKRCKNYCEVEKITLLEIVEEYKNIILNKKTDNISVKEKNKAWDKVAHEFNAVAQTGNRTGSQLKLLYDSIRRKVKRDVQNDKVMIVLLNNNLLI